MTYKWFIFGNSLPLSFSTPCFRKGGGDNGDPAPEPEPDDEGSPEVSYPQDDRK